MAPDAASLPSIPENVSKEELQKVGGTANLSYLPHPQPLCLSIPQRNLTELVVAVTDENIVGLFAALLAERRVLLTASKLSTVRRDHFSRGRDTIKPFFCSVPPLSEQSEEVAQWLQFIGSTI